MSPNLLFSLGPFPIYTFGALVAVSFLLGTFLFWRFGKKEGFSSDDLFDLILITSFTALVGGRALHLALFGGVDHFIDLLRVGEGMLWVGAFVFGFTALAVFVWLKKWSFFRIGDLTALALAFGQSVGFLGAELIDYIPFAFYPALGYLVLGGLLWFLLRRASPGVPFFLYLVFSGVFIYFAEWLRPEKAIWMGVNVNFVFGFLLSLLGVLGLVVILIAKKRPFRVKKDSAR